MLSTVFEEVGGRKVRVARSGHGPALVLLHGYPDNLQIWSELAPRLAESFDVIAFDWPGMGYSEEWPGGATPGHLADRLAVLLDHWNIQQTAVIGMDMGSQPALVFAAKHPERINRLVVMNGLAFHDEHTSWEIEVLRNFGWNRWILRHLPGPVFRRALRTFLPRGMDLPAELKKDLWNSFRRNEVRRFISKMCAGYQGALAQLPSFYARIQAPTLIVWAQNDKHFPPAHAERLHAAIPGSTLRIIAGAEHWMVLHKAEETARVILDFARH